MLTEAQYRTLSFIKAYIAKAGYSPTIAEIARGIGIKSRSTVHRHLQGAAKAGYINIIPNKRRNIELSSADTICPDAIILPILGKIAAGQPIEALTDDASLDLCELLLGPNRYLLRVDGHSMVGDNICDGDLIICKKKHICP